jgi:4-hydroxybutyrate CoA-transferase
VLLAGLSDATVLTAMGPQLPTALVSALLQAARRGGIRLTLMVADLRGRWEFIDDDAVADVAAGQLVLLALAGGIPRRLAGLVGYLPVSLWDVDRLIATGTLPVSIFVMRVGAGDAHRWATYGDMIGYSPSALDVADRVGFEVVPHPRIHPGAGGVPMGRADVVVHGTYTPPERAPARPATREQHAVGRRAAELVPDGATLQVGVGNVPAAVVAHLAGKTDLGVHSGILPGELQPLIASGVITGRRKTVQPGHHVATGLLGGDARAWGADVLLAPVSQTHHPAMLLEHENLWAINSALEVDLAGQVNAEYAGSDKVASGGGQIDFFRAAHASPGGASVVALPARTGSGASRIVPQLDHPVTTPGGDVDFVVTEYGVARLRGQTAHGRAQALIEVAHPKDRPLLREAAAGPVPRPPQGAPDG